MSEIDLEQSAATPPSAIERYLELAQQLVERGRRPTLDVLVATLGGSRTTAQKALTEFWESRLPSLLNAKQAESTVPAPVLEVAAAIWSTAKAAADTAAQDAFDVRMRGLEAREAETDAVLAGVAAERARHEASTTEMARTIGAQKEQLEQRGAEAAAAKEKAATLAQALELREQELEAERSRARELEDRLAAEVQGRAAEVATLRAEHAAATDAAERRTVSERETLTAGHAAAISALKQAYHDGEQRLRVDLDAARTAGSKAEKELTKAKDEIRDLRAELKSTTAALEAALAPRWRRPGIRRRRNPRGPVA